MKYVVVVYKYFFSDFTRVFNANFSTYNKPLTELSHQEEDKSVNKLSQRKWAENTDCDYRTLTMGYRTLTTVTEA